jgi:hypothetical protein
MPAADDSSDHDPADHDPIAQAASDPVIQDLLDRGGQVTDVQVLTDE